MTEPYSAEDLRRAQNTLHHGRSPYGDLKTLCACQDCRRIAAEFAKVRRERDQAAEKLAEALRNVEALFDDEGNFREEYPDQCSVALEMIATALYEHERNAR